MNDRLVDQSWRNRLAEQIREHGRLFFRLAYRVLRSGPMAEDVCQQAFLKAWEHRGSIGCDGSLRGWLARVVLNESLQVARRRKIEQAALERRAVISSDQQEPECRQADARDSILLALAKLPEMTRIVVALRVMEGLSGNAVKELLGCSAAEISRQLHLGMDALRELLAEWDEGRSRVDLAAD